MKDGVCDNIDECSDDVDSCDCDGTTGSCVNNEPATDNLDLFTCTFLTNVLIILSAKTAKEAILVNVINIISLCNTRKFQIKLRLIFI